MVTVSISEGPSFQIEWQAGMNGQDAIESAYNSPSNKGSFKYTLEYYGPNLGYLVNMINETYDSFNSKYQPFFFWQFLINGTASGKGIDQATIKDGDQIAFEFIAYNATAHANTSLHAKYQSKTMS